MNLLINAVEAIQTGVEDFQEGSHPRLLSAVRNVYSGLLLMYKEALRRLSPTDSNEVLLKARTRPERDGMDIRLVGHGKKTVDVQQIKVHFKHLGISTDWVRFESIRIVRNDIEHYFSPKNTNALQSVIANAFFACFFYMH